MSSSDEEDGCEEEDDDDDDDWMFKTFTGGKKQESKPSNIEGPNSQ